MIYCGLTNEEALRVATHHNVNGHFHHAMSHRDYVSQLCWCQIETAAKYVIFVCVCVHARARVYAQAIYNRLGIKCKNGRFEIASQIIDRFYFVDQIFAQFFLLDESCIYSAHVST